MKSIRVFFTLVLFTLFVLPDANAQAKKTNGSLANYGLSGDAELVSNYIVRGLTYSDNNPAMNASFLANFGSQFRFGFWGSNISNLDAVDDNFWMKIFGKINVELSDKLSLDISLTDDHFYKSSQRNGQTMGLDFDYKVYNFGLEWMSNYEGTLTNAEYVWIAKFMDFRRVFRIGAYCGYTNTHQSGYSGYFDFKITGQYVFNSRSSLEAGATLNSNSSQFGVRDDPAVYAGIKLSY